MFALFSAACLGVRFDFYSAGSDFALNGTPFMMFPLNGLSAIIPMSSIPHLRKAHRSTHRLLAPPGSCRSAFPLFHNSNRLALTANNLSGNSLAPAQNSSAFFDVTQPGSCFLRPPSFQHDTFSQHVAPLPSDFCLFASRFSDSRIR